MKIKPNPKRLMRLACGASAALVMLGTARASTNVFNFDSDPSTQFLYTLIASGDNATAAANAGVWFNTDGSTLETNVDASTNGYLQITKGANPSPSSFGHRAVIIFNDFDAGRVVAGFVFDADVRIGAGTDNPADGFSLNYCRSDDNVVTRMDGTGFAGGFDAGGEDNRPEEGTYTGLSVCFDCWPSGGNDVVGITLRLDGNIITNLPMPTLNGDCTDITSLQTGPNTGGLAGLCWQHLHVELTTDQKINLVYKDHTYLTNFPVTFSPSAGRLVFAGRVGGSNQYQDIDNVRLVTIAPEFPVVGAPVANANGFRINIADSGAAIPDTNSVTLKLDGSSITPTAITRVFDTFGNGSTIVAYQDPNLVLPSGSQHTMILHFTGSFNGSVDVTNDYTVPAYTLLTAADKAPASVNTSLTGFTGRINELPIARYPNAGDLIGVERQLADGFIDPSTGQPYANQATVDTFNNDYINWGQDVGFTPDEVGNFQSSKPAPQDVADQAIPGTDRVNIGDPNNLAAEILAELDLQPGSYELAVMADDAFKLTAGAEPRDEFKSKLLMENTQANQETVCYITVTNAGMYPVRLAWGENSGGAQLEFYLIDFSTGDRVLLNDMVNDGTRPPGSQIATYSDTAALTQPYVRWVSPAPGATGVRADSDIVVKFKDGSASSIVDGSIQINGQTPTITGSGADTVATVPSAGAYGSNSTNSVTLVYSTTAGGPFTNTWSFEVGRFQALPIALRTAPGSGDSTKPGFLVKTWYLDTNYLVNVFGYTAGNIGNANDIYEAGMMFTGLWGTNAADTSTFTDNGWYDETGVINYRSAGGGKLEVPPNPSNDEGIFRNSGTVSGYPDQPTPGITSTIQTYPNDNGGGVDNYAMIAKTFVEFPAAGIYTMGVASDDGFEVTVGDSENLAGTLTINAPTPIARSYAFNPNTGLTGDPAYPSTPFPAVTGRVVLCDPPSAESDLVNSNAIKGNIAFFSRNDISDYTVGHGATAPRVERCYQAGAIGVIVFVANGQWVFDPGADIGNTPFAYLNFGDGTNILAYVTKDTSSPVFATFGPGDGAQILGQFDGGRGAGTPTTFDMYVPQAGVYPLRLLYEEGGGGASVEWWSQDQYGAYHLINDSADSGALKAYRARTVSGGAPTVNSISGDSNGSVVSWTGTGELQRADKVTGPYVRTLNAQENPQTNNATGGSTFFRVRQY